MLHGGYRFEQNVVVPLVVISYSPRKDVSVYLTLFYCLGSKSQREASLLNLYAFSKYKQVGWF